MRRKKLMGLMSVMYILIGLPVLAKTMTVGEMITLTKTHGQTAVSQELTSKTNYMDQYSTYNPLSISASINYSPATLSSSAESYGSNNQYNGSFSLSFPGNWQIFSQYEPAMLNPGSGGTTWSIGVGNSIQNILYSSYSHGIKQANLQNKITDLSNIAAMNNQISSNISSYFALIAQKQALKISEISYEEAKVTLKEMKVKYQSGMISKIDLQQQEIEVEEAKLSLQSQKRSNIKAIKNFCNQLNIAYDLDLKLEVPTLPKTTLEEALTHYGKLTKEKTALQDELSRDNITYNDIHTQTIPNITVSGNYGVQPFSNKPNWYISFSTSYSFLPPDFKKEKADIQSVQTGINKNAELLNLDNVISNMKDQYETNVTKFDLAKRSNNIAKIQFSIAKNKFNAGQASYQEYLSAYSTWIGAEQSYLAAFQAYYTTLFQILYPTA